MYSKSAMASSGENPIVEEGSESFDSDDFSDDELFDIDDSFDENF
jgi:hypothetical protein